MDLAALYGAGAGKPEGDIASEGGGELDPGDAGADAEAAADDPVGDGAPLLVDPPAQAFLPH